MATQDNTDYIVGDLVVTKDDRAETTFWVIKSRKPKVEVPQRLSGKYTTKSDALRALGAYEERTMQDHLQDLSP